MGEHFEVYLKTFHMRRANSLDKRIFLMMHHQVRTTNFILYCRKWEQSVKFYRDGLGLPVLFSTDWFVEFRLNLLSRLSIADEKRCSVKSSSGAGITISLEVEDINKVRQEMVENSMNPSEINCHPWNATVFYILDPEGVRIEIWQPAGP